MQRKGTTKDQRRMTWLLWANTVLSDLHHLERKPSFPPPEEMHDDWLAFRKLVERSKIPRVKVRPSERALLIDVGDYLLEQRSVEEENAATLECLLHAAWLLWDANARTDNAGAKAIYDHIDEHWDVMPPPLDELSEDRSERFRVCQGLMREHELVPTWVLDNTAVPARLLDKPSVGDNVEASSPPKVGGMFDDVDR